MAQEIKSIDVENDAEEFYVNTFQKFGWELKSSQRIYNQDTRPVGAISYENMTYVHSRTETVDFTKLVFERDTKMPNYHEVKVLEEEFWELGEIVSEGKPYMPPHAETMEGWAKHFEPDVRSNRERMRVHIVWGIISVALFMACMVIATALEESTRYFDGAIGAWCIIFIIAFSIFLWRRAAKSSKKRALELAVHSQTSEYRKVLEKMYASVTAQISLYDASVKRMQEIIAEANELID